MMLNPKSQPPVKHDRRLHVLGLAHTIADGTFSYCAFTSLTMTFCKMMKEQGWEIVFYGVEGCNVVCDEFVQCLSLDEYKETYACNLQHNAQYKFNWDDGKAWPLFAQRCEIELRKRICGKEIVCVGGGSYHGWVNNVPNAIPVDPHVGHKGIITNYRVFPSKTWRSFVYGLYDSTMCQKQYPPAYWKDAVIYHYLDEPGLIHDFVTMKDGYGLFIGRLNFDKGVYDVMKACADKGLPLKVMGANHPSTEIMFHDKCKEYGTEYVGTLAGAQKNNMIKGADVLFCPSYYNEPFGLVAIEAQMAGVPVICSDWGAYSETIVHGVTGYRITTYSDLLKSIDNIHEIRPRTCHKWAFDNFHYTVAGRYYNNYFLRVLDLESDNVSNPWYSTDMCYNNPQDLRLNHEN